MTRPTSTKNFRFTAARLGSPVSIAFKINCERNLSRSRSRSPRVCRVVPSHAPKSTQHARHHRGQPRLASTGARSLLRITHESDLPNTEGWSIGLTNTSRQRQCTVPAIHSGRVSVEISTPRSTPCSTASARGHSRHGRQGDWLKLIVTLLRPDTILPILGDRRCCPVPAETVCIDDIGIAATA